jgi:hypothetical protein
MDSIAAIRKQKADSVLQVKKSKNEQLEEVKKRKENIAKSNEKKIFPYDTFFKMGGRYCTEED